LLPDSGLKAALRLVKQCNSLFVTRNNGALCVVYSPLLAMSKWEPSLIEDHYSILLQCKFWILLPSPAGKRSGRGSALLRRLPLRTVRASFPAHGSSLYKGAFRHPGITTVFIDRLMRPRFSVTRLTAKALPLNEWVSSHCRAFALLCLPSCVAFTIRVCSPLTWRWTSAQLMPRHATSEGAHAHVAAFICFPPVKRVLKTLLWRETLRKSARFRVECYFNPYPSDYRMAFAFSSILYPHWHRRSLRFACRNFRRQYGLTMFHTRYRNRVDPASPPVTFLSLCPQKANEQPITYLLVKAYQHLGLVKYHGVYQQFTYVGLTIQPSSPATWCWQQLESPHGLSFSYKGLHCPSGFRPSRYQLRLHR